MSYVMNCLRCKISWMGERDLKCFLCNGKVSRRKVPESFSFKGVH
jgi:hypothetical protein